MTTRKTLERERGLCVSEAQRDLLGTYFQIQMRALTAPRRHLWLKPARLLAADSFINTHGQDSTLRMGQFVVNARPGFLLAIARRVADEPTSTPRSSHGERPSAPHRNLFPDVVCQTRPPPRARAFLTHSPPIRKYRARTRTTLLSIPYNGRARSERFCFSLVASPPQPPPRRLVYHAFICSLP